MIGLMWWFCAFIMLVYDIKNFESLSKVPVNSIVLICTFLICGSIFMNGKSK